MSLADPLLSRRAHKPPPALTLWDEVSLRLSRVHELCGRARRTFALRLAGQLQGPVFWIAPPREAAQMNADGMARFVALGRVHFVAPRHGTDLLWCMEECLRAGCAPVVICDLPEPPSMTPVRRLHLAAETGAALGMGQPLGLILTPGEGGAAGIETRWRMEPAHEPGRDIWQLARIRARMQPPKTWRLEGDRLMPDPDRKRPALQAQAAS